MKFLRFLPLFLLGFCISELHAEVKIGVIDTNKIIENCTAYVEAKKVIEGEFNKSEKEAGEMQEKFSKKAEDLENKKNVVAAKEYNKKREELTKEAKILQKKFYDQRVNLEKEFNNVNKVLNDNLADIIKNLSEKKHMTVALDKGHKIPLPTYRIRPEVLRQVVKACRNKLRLEVDYRSVNAPDTGGRIIVPHSIVHSGMRWHVRAYCEKNNDYRDFVLTRFYGTPETDGQAKHSVEQDEAWNTMVNVCFTPDQRLSPEQQAIVANDYGMSDKRLLIQVRGALVPYLMQMMRIDINVVAADPRAQQVVIQNMEAVKQWLFR